MIEEDLYERIKEKIMPILEDIQMELVELNVRRKQKDIAIEILADKPQGGISLGECTKINRQIQRVLDEDALLSEHYTLEVASPGLDRPLKTKADFLRMMDQKVQVFLLEKVNDRMEYTGIIKGVDEENVLLQSKNQETYIPLNHIQKGKYII